MRVSSFSIVLVFQVLVMVTGEAERVLRLSLVRHGETEANAQGLVVGQSHSPLTPRGIEQAEALGRSNALQRIQPPDAIYCSNMDRARETLALMSCNVSPVYDARLRELSKGAKQGYPKTWSYKQALEQRQIDGAMDMPVLESYNDGWKRFMSWLRGVWEETTHENVLVVSHAGLLRVWLTRILGKQRLMELGTSFAEDGRLIIPNTSLTVMELRCGLSPDSAVSDEDWNRSFVASMRYQVKELLWTTYKDVASEKQPSMVNDG